MIFGDRLKQARELRGLTQEKLAKLLNVTQSLIAQIESGRVNPSEEIANGLVFHLGFPPSFFEQPLSDDFPLGSLLFRAHAALAEGQQREIYRWAQTAYDLYSRMLSVRKVHEIKLHVPQCKASPAIASDLARSELGISPDTPIPNLINTLEKAGVLAIALPGSFPGRDAFSLWAAGKDGQRRPVIAIVSERPADRMRMSVAHELGHLVMHQPLVIGAGDVEDQAQQFAGCFLMPEVAMRQEIIPPVTLETFMNLKVKWRASMQALVLRAHKLDIITQRQYHYLFGKLVARGWRMREPRSLDVPLERPRAMRQVAELIYGNPINYQRLAADAKMNESFVREIIDLHAGRPHKVSDPLQRDTPKKKEEKGTSRGVVIRFPAGRRKD